VKECSVELTLPPRSAAVYAPGDHAGTSYTFYKPRILGGAWP
jgi:hypothetical protein